MSAASPRPRVGRGAPRRRRSVAVVALAIIGGFGSIGAACGRPSAADRDPPVIDGKRVRDNPVEDFSDSGNGQGGAPAPVEMGPPAGAGAASGGAATEAPKVLLAGDSIAFFLSIPIVNGQKGLGIVAQTQAKQVCGLVPVTAMRHEDGSLDPNVALCTWPATWAPGELDAFRPDVVLLATGAPPIVEYQIEGQFRAPCDATFDAWYTAEFAKVVDLLGSRGAFVAVANTAYPATFPAIPHGVERTDCLNRDMAAAIVGKRAAIVDLRSWVCPGGTCATTRDGVVLRPDGVHYTKEGADLVAAWLVPEALRLAGRAPARPASR